MLSNLDTQKVFGKKVGTDLDGVPECRIRKKSVGTMDPYRQIEYLRNHPIERASLNSDKIVPSVPNLAHATLI
jgi:hypothetical protein